MRGAQLWGIEGNVGKACEAPLPRPPRQILTPGARGMCTDKVSEGSRRRGVWRTCVPCASAPSCELGSNLLRPARDPAESAPCYLAQRLSSAGGSGRVRRRSTAARGALSPQPQPAAPPMERSAQRQLRCPAIGLSVATCRLPASSLGFRSRAKKFTDILSALWTHHRVYP